MSPPTDMYHNPITLQRFERYLKEIIDGKKAEGIIEVMRQEGSATNKMTGEQTPIFTFTIVISESKLAEYRKKLGDRFAE